jgi:hypothetical protein
MENEKTSREFEKIFIKDKSSQQIGLANLTKAIERYNSLINRGLIRKRGYTLRGIEDTHLYGSNPILQ